MLAGKFSLSVPRADIVEPEEALEPLLLLLAWSDNEVFDNPFRFSADLKGCIKDAATAFPIPPESSVFIINSD